jgi:hypothetical protein
MQVVQSTQAYCTANNPWYMVSSCMNYYSPQFQAAYDSAYQQTLSQCTGSCQ